MRGDWASFLRACPWTRCMPFRPWSVIIHHNQLVINHQLASLLSNYVPTEEEKMLLSPYKDRNDVKLARADKFLLEASQIDRYEVRLLALVMHASLEERISEAKKVTLLQLFQILIFRMLKKSWRHPSLFCRQTHYAIFWKWVYYLVTQWMERAFVVAHTAFVFPV